VAGRPGPVRAVEDGVETARRFSKDGTWDLILQALLVQADAAGQIDGQVSVDATVSRVHQGPAVTETRLEKAISPAFAGLYQTQQSLLGRATPTGLTAAASCRRNDKTSASQGAGDDWTCQLLLHLGIGATYTYEVNAKADGCYSAQGSLASAAASCPPCKALTASIHCSAFDGCFDTQ